jgi:hypothetical protein
MAEVQAKTADHRERLTVMVVERTEICGWIEQDTLHGEASGH